MILLDVKAAFPSLAHSWMFAVCRALGLSAGARNLLGMMYLLCPAFVQSQDGLLLLASCRATRSPVPSLP